MCTSYRYCHIKAESVVRDVIHLIQFLEVRGIITN